MINFFRKIRKKLADDNQFLKYSRYAVGEIVLVVIGILIALQINNWNVNNARDVEFKISLDQLYTSLKYDYEMQKFHRTKFKEQLILIDSLLNNDFDKADKGLLSALFRVEWLPGPGFTVSNSNFYISQLKFDNDEISKANLAFQISSYFSMLEDYLDVEWNNAKVNYISPILGRINIPLLRKHEELAYLNFSKDDESIDSTIAKIKPLLKTKEFRSALLLTKLRIQRLNGISKKRNAEGLALIKSIKKYNPNSQLKIDDIILVGSALEKEGIIPMKLTDVKECVWEVEIIKKKEG